MAHVLSTEAQKERDDVIAEIHLAFASVTREGGTSWNETKTLDHWGSQEECEIARRSDKDKRWPELVDDADWQPFPGIGGFSFINPTGFRYYLPPTMIRFLRGNVSEWYDGHLLGVMEGFILNSSGVYTKDQLRAIARFVSFMARFDTTGYREADDTIWQDALSSQWQIHLTEEEPRRAPK